MDIREKADPIRSRPVFIRLTPDLFDWVNELTVKTGGSFANTVREILRGAREEGVSVLPNDEDEPEPRVRRRRKPEPQPEVAQA